MVLETNVEIRYQEILPTLSPDDHNFLHQSPVWVGFFPIRDKKNLPTIFPDLYTKSVLV